VVIEDPVPEREASTVDPERETEDEQTLGAELVLLEKILLCRNRGQISSDNPPQKQQRSELLIKSIVLFMFSIFSSINGNSREHFRHAVSITLRTVSHHNHTSRYHLCKAM
jgi:hypothetical protein